MSLKHYLKSKLFNGGSIDLQTHGYDPDNTLALACSYCFDVVPHLRSCSSDLNALCFFLVTLLLFLLLFPTPPNPPIAIFLIIPSHTWSRSSICCISLLIFAWTCSEDLNPILVGLFRLP